MTVISTAKDAAQLTLTVVAEFGAGPDRVWDVWEDPRELERWWGPPTFPATFTRHDFTVGGESRYFMTGPSGEKPRGWWRIDAIDKPHRLEFANGLAGDDGEPMPGVLPMLGSVTFEAVESGTRMTVADSLRQRRSDAEDARYGHAGRHDPGSRPDRWAPRAGRSLIAIVCPRPRSRPGSRLLERRTRTHGCPMDLGAALRELLLDNLTVSIVGPVRFLARTRGDDRATVPGRLPRVERLHQPLLTALPSLRRTGARHTGRPGGWALRARAGGIQRLR